LAHVMHGGVARASNGVLQARRQRSLDAWARQVAQKRLG
jgi:hypothetical protein